MFTREFDLFNATPANEKLSQRAGNEVYSMAAPKQVKALYFPEGGNEVSLHTEEPTTWQVKWLDMEKSAFTKTQTLKSTLKLNLISPEGRHWLALITPK